MFANDEIFKSALRCYLVLIGVEAQASDSKNFFKAIASSL